MSTARKQQILQQARALQSDVQRWQSVYKNSMGTEEANAKRNREAALSQLSQLLNEAHNLGRDNLYEQIDQVVSKAYAFNS